jgi:glycosyltransferase involved in cell wall biosynthesis
MHRADERPLILVGPLPLPCHGLSVTFELLRDQLVSRGIPHRIVDTADRRQWPFVPRLPRRLIEWVFIGARYAVLAARRRTTVYLIITQSRAGLMRDIFVIAIAAMMGHRVVLHANCGDYGGFWRAQPRWLRHLMRVVLRQAETIVVPSGRLAGMFDFEPRLQARIEVVPNAAPTAEPPVTHRTPPKHEIRLVYLSNFIATKGYAEVIRAVAILRHQHELPVTCRLVGEFLVDDGAAMGARTRAEAHTNLQRIINDEQLEEHVTILPAAGRARKNEILRDSHFLLLPTRYQIEAQPVAIIEAMAAGCVPIAPDYRAIPDLIVDGRTGVLAGPDPADIAEAIADLYDHPERYATMSRAAVAHHRELFTAELHLMRMSRLLLRSCRMLRLDGDSPREVDAIEERTIGDGAEVIVGGLPRPAPVAIVIDDQHASL